MLVSIIRIEFLKFLRDDGGQDLIEYALLAALVALACVTSMKVLANYIGNAFSSIGSALQSNTAT